MNIVIIFVPLFTNKYNTNMRLSEKLKKKKPLTIYRQVAIEVGTSVDYVGKIARGERKPSKKVGLAVKQRLESLTN